MKINLTGNKQLEITPALRQLTEEKLKRLAKHDSSISHIDVTFDVEKQQQIARATLHIAGGPINAIAESSDMYQSIDLLVDKLDSQLIKHKEKKKNH